MNASFDWKNPYRLALVLVCAVLVCAAWRPSFAAPPPEPLEPKVGGLIGLPMYTDPALPEQPVERVFHERLKPLWLSAMQRDEATLRLEAVKAFVRAREEGMSGLNDVAPKFVTLLGKDADRAVRLAAANALVQFNHRAAAEAMLRARRRSADGELALVVDPALARWSYKPAYQHWRTCVQDDSASLTVRRSAAAALGIAEDRASADVLRGTVTSNQTPPAVRLAAADALGRCVASGLAQTAEPLANDDRLSQLLAAKILRSHNDDSQAITILRRLVRSDDPAVTAAAVRSLNRVSRDAVVTMRRELRSHDDANVRLALVEALGASTQPGVLDALGRMLPDRSLAVRRRAREALVSQGQRMGEREAALNVLSDALDADAPAGLEQAAHAAGQLGHNAAATRLTALLGDDDARVRLAAANALRKLAVPATAAPMLERLKRIDTRRSTPPSAEAAQTATQLVMALGALRYAPASPVLREVVPKDAPHASQVRAAAVWALGHIHADSEEQALSRTLRGRLTDTNMNNPESENVRRFAAISLGRIGAGRSLGPLRRVSRSEQTTWELRRACLWAIERITGEAAPAPTPTQRQVRGWFLEPME